MPVAAARQPVKGAPKSAPENRPESLTSFRATNRRLRQLGRSPSKCSQTAERRSAPERIRTSDLRFRRPTLYPAELRAQRRAIVERRFARGGHRGVADSCWAIHDRIWREWVSTVP